MLSGGHSKPLGGVVAQNSDSDITWITVKGNHIPIKKGQKVSEVIEEFFKKKNNEPSDDGIITNLIKTIEQNINSTKCITKETPYFYPKTIASISKGQSMSFTQADNKHCNPNYNRLNKAYSHNCQSCVVAYEARRRGYNVQAMPRQTKGKTAELAIHSSWAWIEPKTGKKCEYTYINTNNAQEHRKYLEQNIKYGERYQYSYMWIDKNNKKHRHVVIAEKDNYNKLTLFDAQTGIVYQDKNLNTYLKKHLKPRILRIDDKQFNPYFMNDVLKKY